MRGIATVNPNIPPTPGERVARIRKLRGLTQKDVARLGGLSLRTVKSVEQDDGNFRLETLAAVARVLAVNTSEFLQAGEPEPGQVPAEPWDDVIGALYQHAPAEEAAEPASEDGILAVLDGLRPALAANRYADARAVLPGLIRDSAGLGRDGRTARSRVLNTTAWLLTMTRQWEDSVTAARLALDAAPDIVDSLAAVNTLCWSLLRQGRLAEAAQLAVKWGDDAEPRMSKAPTAHIAAWGKVMLYVDNSLLRDNRPGDAEDALSLAKGAAAVVGKEVQVDASTTRTFGPSSVLMIAAENASLTGQPDRVLSLAGRVPRQGLLHAGSASRLRHRLDVANAHAMRREYADVVGVMGELRDAAPEWLAHQQYGRHILEDILHRRRGPLTEELRDLAAAVSLPV